MIWSNVIGACGIFPAAPDRPGVIACSFPGGKAFAIVVRMLGGFTRPVCLGGALHCVLIAGGLLLSACERAQDSEAAAANAVAEPKPGPGLTMPDAIPAPEPELDRARLLEAVARAASAYAAGVDDSAEQAELARRRFTIKLRFGCTGPTEDIEQVGLGWSYDEAEQRLRIRAAPNLMLSRNKTPEREGAPADPIEAVEGFWIQRPWMLTDACPAQPGEQSAPGEGSQSVGIAQFFSSEESRLQRRSGRAYETTTKVEPAAVPRGVGFNLVLRGRLSAPPGRKLIQCSSRGGNVPPQCIVAAEFDEISLEDPQTGRSIADWRSG